MKGIRPEIRLFPAVGWLLALLLSAAAREKAVAGRLACFEKEIPVARESRLGFRPADAGVMGWAAGDDVDGTGRAVVELTPEHPSVFFQAGIRRLYLLSGSGRYVPGGADVLRFWVRIPSGSPLLSDSGERTFGVWTYHWKPGDAHVGGANNRGLATDSMMHGYAEFSFRPECSGRWVRVQLSEMAFQKQRDYYHWYAASGVTAPYDFWATLRQVQFVRLVDGHAGRVDWELDCLGLERRPRLVEVVPSFHRAVAPPDGEIRVPIRILNPTSRDRTYRYFVSSALGADRETLYEMVWKTDSLVPARSAQKVVKAGGGIGPVRLHDAMLRPVGYREIPVRAGESWKGYVVHRMHPGMRTGAKKISFSGKIFSARRDTLLTTVLFWDPHEPVTQDEACLVNPGSNADEPGHRTPPGFPRQEPPPPGWRSRDVPLHQPGGTFVSMIRIGDDTGRVR